VHLQDASRYQVITPVEEEESPCRKSSPTTNRAARRKSISLAAAAARLAGNEPTGGSFRRRQCRFFGRLGADSPTAKVRMPSTVMTPGALFVRGHIRIRCCTLWRRRLLVIRLGHRQILRHCNGRQCADNQGAAYKSDIHARLRALLQIRMPMLSVHSSTRWPREIVLTASASTPAPAIATAPAQRHDNSIDAAAIFQSSDNLRRQNDPNTVPRTRTAASAITQVTITVITISK